MKHNSWRCHYIMTVLTTIACFSPLSVIGLIQFNSASSARDKGDYESAIKHKRSAKRWSVVACVVGLFVTAACIFVALMVAAKIGYISVKVEPVRSAHHYDSNPDAVRFWPEGVRPHDRYPSDPNQVNFLPEPTYASNPDAVHFQPEPQYTKYPHNPDQVHFLPDATKRPYPSNPDQVHFLSDNTNKEYPSDPDLVHFLPESVDSKYPSNPDEVHFVPEEVYFEPDVRPIKPKYVTPSK